MRKIRPRSRAVKKSEESQRVLDALDAYLEGNIDEPVRWLVRFWQDQAAVMLYRELRELVIGETDPESLFDIWFQDYSKMLSEKMTPVWEQAFLEGGKNNSLFCGAEDVISSESWVRSWIVDHTGDLITNCCNEQVSAIRYLIAEAESLNMSSAETARYIRPTIGLTERQAAANLKYYNSIKERLTTDHPRMKPESIERKAREAASKYAERQQRYRAETIARSEIAQAYNHGADAFVREAVTAGNLPEMEKEWSTALNGHVCASCAALEGTKIGMDDEFKTVSGRREIKSIMNSAGMGEDENMQYIGDPDAFLLAYATNAPSIDEPSAGYIFTWDMLGNGQMLPILNYLGENGTHTEYVEGLMATDMHKTSDDLARFYKSAV